MFDSSTCLETDCSVLTIREMVAPGLSTLNVGSGTSGYLLKEQETRCQLEQVVIGGNVASKDFP